VPERVRTAVRRVALVAAGLALLTVVGCSTSGSSADTNGIGTGQGTIALIKAADREPAPVLAGPLVGGGHGSLRGYAGQVVVLNVWASWCGPCRRESAGLVAAAKSLPKVAFLGINTRDNEGNAAAFVRAEGVPYPSFADQDGRLVLQLQRVLDISGLPVTVVLDRQHRVAAAIYGPTTAITIEEIVKPLEREA
jgi:thiol-disulfide isomerase/thioredoxin